MVQPIDSLGNGPLWKAGDKVWIGHTKVRATVVEQLLSYSEDESYWNDVLVRYDNGIVGVEKSWQIMRIHE